MSRRSDGPRHMSDHHNSSYYIWTQISKDNMTAHKSPDCGYLQVFL